MKKIEPKYYINYLLCLDILLTDLSLALAPSALSSFFAVNLTEMLDSFKIIADLRERLKQ